MHHPDRDSLSPGNARILAERSPLVLARTGPAEGDFIRLPRTDPRQPEFERITYAWPDGQMQTGGMGGSYYLCSTGHCDYSGSLDPGIQASDLLHTAETRMGCVWFFDENEAGAGRGLSFTIPFRIYNVRPKADISGLHSLESGYSLIDRGGHGKTEWQVLKNTYSHKVFTTREDLDAWLADNRLALPGDPEGCRFLSLAYA